MITKSKLYIDENIPNLKHYFKLEVQLFECPVLLDLICLRIPRATWSCLRILRVGLRGRKSRIPETSVLIRAVVLHFDIESLHKIIFTKRF